MKKTIKLEKNSYLCTMKPFRGMNMIKRVALLAVLAVPATGLMEKVEELTLYIIDLQKQINELKSNK